MINFFSRYKFIFYLSNFILLVLYLYPGSFIGCFLFNNCQYDPQITPDFLVSTNHLYAFVLLSIIGIFTYKNSFSVLSKPIPFKIFLFYSVILISEYLKINKSKGCNWLVT